MRAAAERGREFRMQQRAVWQTGFDEIIEPIVE